MVKKFNNIMMYKDSSLYRTWEAPFEDNWDVEVKGDMARVYSNNPWAHKPSAYRKLKFIRKVKDSNKSVFRLTVNGQKAFFVIALNIR